MYICIKKLMGENTRIYRERKEAHNTVEKRWLLEVFLWVLACVLVYTNSNCDVRFYQHGYTVMIHPAGHVQNTGRLIDQSFERSIALYAAEAIKKKVEEVAPHVNVFLTRMPGQQVTAFHNAQAANSLAVALFLTLHFYQEMDIKPHIYIYQFSYNNTLTVRPSDFMFYRYDQSYLFNRISSAQAATILADTWVRQPYANQFTTHSVIGFPCASLIGIIMPALVLDIGIKTAADWHQYVQPLAESIVAYVHTLDTQLSTSSSGY